MISMDGLLEVASAILSTSGQRVDVAAQNISNMETPGFKRHVAFAALLDQPPNIGDETGSVNSRSDFSQGALQGTGSSADLAIAGPGFFTVRLGDEIAYTRAGDFIRDHDRLVRPDGYALQAASGGDLVLKPGAFTVASDGTVTQSGAEIARIALVNADKPEQLQPVEGGFLAPASVVMDEAAAPVVHQGMLEASNVASGREMVSIIEASRTAEAGQQLIQVYDELLGRAFNALGGA